MFWNSKERAEQKARKLAEKIKRDLARAAAWRAFWFKTQVACGLFAVFTIVCCGVMALNPNNGTTTTYSRVVSPPIQNTKPVDPVQKTKESDAEKNYERESGNEIVHRKDGTDYIRKTPKKK